MTQQRIIEIWKQLEGILDQTVPLLDELDELYKKKYSKEITEITKKLLSVQEDIVIIDMRETMENKQS